MLVKFISLQPCLDRNLESSAKLPEIDKVGTELIQVFKLAMSKLASRIGQTYFSQERAFGSRILPLTSKSLTLQGHRRHRFSVSRARHHALQPLQLVYATSQKRVEKLYVNNRKKITLRQRVFERLAMSIMFRIARIDNADMMKKNPDNIHIEPVSLRDVDTSRAR